MISKYCRKAKCEACDGYGCTCACHEDFNIDVRNESDESVDEEEEEFL